MSHFSQNIHFAEIGSTHAYALKMGALLPDLALVTADFQTDGRGRSGRAWQAPRGEAILFSMVLKPRISPDQAALVTPIMSLAIAQALAKSGVDPSIRWPNDVVVKGNKIAGVLAQASLDGDSLRFIVAGAGINVNQSREWLSSIDRPATSLLAETGRIHRPAMIMDAVISEFLELYAMFLETGFDSIWAKWSERSSMTGRSISLDLGAKIVKGLVRGFSRDGSIIIEDDQGELSCHRSGEVIRLEEANERRFG